MGDEIGLLNDRSYLDDPERAHDSRWLHRPATDWVKAARRYDATTVEGQIYSGVRHILARRKATPHLHARGRPVDHP